MENKENQEIFIETSVMTDYLLKDKEKVDRILSSFNKRITSNYVRMEFKKGPLQYLIYLHNKLVICQNMAEVHQAISELSCGYQRHRLSSILEHIAGFYRKYRELKPSDVIKEYGDMSIDNFLREKAISYLSIQIRNSWRGFDKAVNEIINSMNCFIDIQAPYKKNTSKLYINDPRTCEKSINKCEIKEFFRKNIAPFNKILEELKRIDSPDQETKRRIQVLYNILRLIEFNREVSEKDCWICSDAIIAVETPEGAAIFNNNKKHYDPICNAIGKINLNYS